MILKRLIDDPKHWIDVYVYVCSCGDRAEYSLMVYDSDIPFDQTEEAFEVIRRFEFIHRKESSVHKFHRGSFHFHSYRGYRVER
jgi:hypothetical protein